MDRFSWTSSSNLCILQGESGIHQQSGVRIYDGDKKVRTYCLNNVNNSYFTSTCRVCDRTNYTVTVLSPRLTVTVLSPRLTAAFATKQRHLYAAFKSIMYNIQS